MAEAKISIETIVNDEGLKKLNNELGQGQNEVKRLTKDLKDLEKKTKNGTEATKEQIQEMNRLSGAINSQKNANAQLQKSIRKTTDELVKSGKQASGVAGKFKDLAGQIKGMASQKLGIDLNAVNLSMAGIVASAGLLAKTLVDSGREISALSNQFISFASNADHAREIYNKFNDVARNMNSSYDEQKIYDMGKSLMAVGINADESAELITKCADASAKLGKSAEFTEELTKAFTRLKTGGELTEKQYKAIAEAGIDLTDVQDKMRAGGEQAYEALKQKLDQYKGGMDSTKKTAREMEADIKANLVEIGRQTAVLIDDFFGFSDMLKTFYQWVIDTTQAVINGIKRMINAVHDAKISSDAYREAMEAYGEIDEDNTDEVMARSKWVEERVKMVEAETKELEAQNKIYAETKEIVKSIAKVSAGASGGTGGAGRTLSATGSTKSTTKELSVDDKFKMELQHIRNLMDIDKQSVNVYKESELKKLEEYKANLQERLGAKKEFDEEYITLENNLAEVVREIQKNTTDEHKKDVNGVREYYKGLASSFASAMADCITGAKSFGDAFKQIIQQIINQLITAVLYATILSALGVGGEGTFSKNFSKNFKSFMHFADGGYVSGAGTGTSDSISARLSNGEYVMNAEAVKRIGVGNLNRMNYGTQNFADGGAVGGNGNITLNVQTMDAQSFEGFLQNGAFDKIKQAFSNDNRNFADAVGVW